ncbi:MAG: bifunctional nicotinamidase/pyrazinamidase [Gammaproteobacteria bacterium]|nr:bifunctional nicotinamidase/pyrazinamidase [Gammaproteobacteria bacterium]
MTPVRRASRRALLRALAGWSLAAALPPGVSRLQAAGTGAAGRSRTSRPDARSALLIVDVQNCFVTGGSLAVPHGEDVIPVINRLAGLFATVVATQDWHTPHHVSFASSHSGRKPYETIELAYGTQVLWPDHCVMGTDDASLVHGLDTSRAQLVIRKGFHEGLDSYSAFYEADHRTASGLAGYLRERRVRRVFVCGLATDFCVAWTALDARRAGFDTAVVEDACRGIDLNGSLAAAWESMSAAGVHRIRSENIADFS